MKQANPWIAVAACALALAGCGDDGAGGGNEVRQTRFPGQVSAGGGTSGEIMARNAPATTPGSTPGTAGPTGAPGARETVRGQAPAGGVAGTPSIPEGAGGTPSGAAMGGTTSGAAATETAPPAGIPAQGGK